ncbi:uncharacterized protein F4822DRAFT_105172 [Hypoxylon trugodes]|uniref:uncharacterized protein n=1 Tax=Hypoxylon trugodes TaxID=326681 RepID=UPI002193FD4A|nr:uncharacterized protein F4822DRAFT_105172 [Hypoxylon trugodes]KAI1391770.1 hypothetical protein F4822DRAFT_105172 [Hypoxylon trugodes]
MFSRIKGAIDRSIAEEQARQRVAAEQRSNSPSASGQRPRSVSRTNSTNSPARRKTKRPSQDQTNGDGATNPDPAVFEAAFVLDDEDADATSGLPEKPGRDAVVNNEKDGGGDATEQNGETQDQSNNTLDEKPKDALSPAPAELPPHVKTKLRKLEKLEATYPGNSFAPRDSSTSH